MIEIILYTLSGLLIISLIVICFMQNRTIGQMKNYIRENEHLFDGRQEIRIRQQYVTPLEEIIETLNKQKRELQTQGERDREALTAANEAKAELQKDFDALKATVTLEKKSDLELAEEQRKTREEVQRYKNESQYYNDQYRKFESLLRDTQIREERLKNDLAAMKDEVEKKRREIEGLNLELSEKSRSNSTTSEDLHRRESQLEVLTASLSEYKEKHANEMRERKTSNLELEKTLLRLEQEQEQNLEISSRSVEKQRLIESMTTELDSAREELNTVRQKLAKREELFAELEKLFESKGEESTYDIHKYIEWTINQFEEKKITFRFINRGLKMFLVGVEPGSVDLKGLIESPSLLEPNEEARFQVIAKEKQHSRTQLPEDFEVVLWYALSAFPVKFRITPGEGQKIHRIH